MAVRPFTFRSPLGHTPGATKLSLGKRIGLAGAGLGLAASGLGLSTATGQQVLGGVTGYFHDRAATTTVELNPQAHFTPSGELKVVTYNIEEGGRDLPAVERYLKAQAPDAVLLQEASVASGRKLAQDLGMNAVYGGNWKIILTAMPIKHAESINYPISDLERVRSVWQTKQGEPLEVRGVLDVTAQNGARTVHLMDSHTSTQNEDWVAREYNALADHVAGVRATGADVILGGDFNANLALAEPGGVDARGTPTDTVSEFVSRYKPDVGLMGDGRVRSAAERLTSELADGWTAAPDANVTLHGKTLTRDEAAALVAAGKGTYDIQRGMDGVTHPGTQERIDGLFTSDGLTATHANVDQDLPASDHRPLVETFSTS